MVDWLTPSGDGYQYHNKTGIGSQIEMAWYTRNQG
jgi:hypothetical protein